MTKEAEEIWAIIKEAHLENKKIRAIQKENIIAIKEMQKEIGGIGNSQEEVGLDLFRRNMKGILKKRGVNVDDISTRFKSSVKINGEKIEGEYDLMGINGKEIVVVEVKNKLKTDHIKKFTKTQLSRFKLLFPQYKDYKLYGGVGSLVVGDSQEKQAEKAGLFVFTQGEDGNAMIMNKPDFKAKVF